MAEIERRLTSLFSGLMSKIEVSEPGVPQDANATIDCITRLLIDSVNGVDAASVL